MTESNHRSTASTPVEWERAAADRLEPPLHDRTPYVEVKLEHPRLEATAFGDSFFPDAVPYRLDGDARVFFWRNAFLRTDASPSRGSGLCATTHGLDLIPENDASTPTVCTQHENTYEVIVDGTIAGDSRAVELRDYSPPDVRLRRLTGDSVEIATATGALSVSAGERRRVELDEQVVRSAETGARTTTRPTLVVRYPGRRTVVHPAVDADYALFPSFGLDVESIPNPLPVPTRNGELDESALAERLGVDQGQRPYPERVLWQAFCYTAFDPHRETPPRLVQFPGKQLAVANPQ